MSEALQAVWPTASLGDYADFKNGINFTKEQKGEVGVPTIDVKNMYGHGFAAGVENLYRVDKVVNDDYFLEAGDLLFVRSSLKQEGIGWTSQFVSNSEPTTFCGFIIRARLKDQETTDPSFLTFYFRSDDARRALIASSGKVAITNISQGILSKAPIPLPPLPEQKKIAHILSTVQRAIEAQERIIQTTTELKKALMHKLFTEGLRNEPQKQTEIGPVPMSWETPTVESVCTIKASAMSYMQLEAARNVPNGIRVIGIKVSDMNLPGNQIEFRSANLERQLPENEAIKRTVPANSIVFPKRGAAIATNKKRLTLDLSVLDPNLIAVIPTKSVCHRYLFHWFKTFDLKTITDPGPTPQLNKKDIAPLKFPMPPIEEQQAIAAAIDTAEERTALHSRKRDQFQDLFRNLLHELMTAKTRVHEIEFGKEAVV